MFRLPPGRIGNLSELDKIGERAAAGCMGENYRFLKRHRWLLLLIKSSGKSKLQGAVYERALRRKAKRSRAPTIVSALIGVFGSRATALKTSTTTLMPTIIATPLQSTRFRKVEGSSFKASSYRCWTMTTNPVLPTGAKPAIHRPA